MLQDDAGKALHAGAIATLSRLMDGDPAVGTAQGDALTLLADAIEAYERATLPPPYGTADVIASDPATPNTSAGAACGAIIKSQPATDGVKATDDQTQGKDNDK